MDNFISIIDTHIWKPFVTYCQDNNDLVIKTYPTDEEKREMANTRLINFTQKKLHTDKVKSPELLEYEEDKKYETIAKDWAN